MTNDDVLINKWFEFKKKPFPTLELVSEEEYSNIYPDAVEFDGYVAGIISSSLKNGIYAKKILIDENLKSELLKIKDKYQNTEIESFCKYFDELNKLVDEYRLISDNALGKY